jgi:hypothetical protein
MGLKIIGDKVVYTKSFKYGLLGTQPSFNIKIEDIKIVGYKLTTISDDNLYFVLIDKNVKVYMIHVGLVDKDTENDFFKYFSIVPLSTNYPDSWYYQGYSFIIYPFMNDNLKLFKSWKESFWSNLFLWFKKILLLESPVCGILTEECKQIVRSS